MTTTDRVAGPKQTTTSTLRTAPGGVTQPVVLPMPKPGIVILIHGVNDVGEAFANQELGICLGLSERLGRVGPGPSKMLLTEAYYRTPHKATESEAEDRNAVDPDAVYYRRHHTKARANQNAIPNSVVIPFYWGYREEEGTHRDDKGNVRPNVRRNERHGEYLDRYGNRLDKDSAKNGGPFANATNNIPAMWSAGFEAMPLDAGSTKTRPLLSAGPRNYMVLAAHRLAMLVRMIRAKQENDTINVVAHSQGCLITLLANALLAKTGDRPIDTFVMNHPPYGLGELMIDKLTLGGEVQTVEARLGTLTGIVGFMTAAPHQKPAFASLGDSGKGAPGNAVITGKDWSPTRALKRPQGKTPSPPTHFDERDNRGKVYLYFCPDDQTVALLSVQGIGWQGVPDSVSMFTTDSYQQWRRTQAMVRGSQAKDYMVMRPALDALGPRFKQRCFTRRVRDKRPLLVGDVPAEYNLEAWHEFLWNDTTLGVVDRLARGGFDSGYKVRITGEALSPPVPPQMGSDWEDISPIDASIAITRDRLRPKNTVRRVFAALANRPTGVLSEKERLDIDQIINSGKEPVESVQVLHPSFHLGEGVAQLVLSETPNEARRRWMDTQKTEDNKKSSHSSIVANPDHSRGVTAYDLGIGQAKSIDNAVYYLFLCLVADWRTDWDQVEKKVAKNTQLSNAEIETYQAAFALRDRESGHTSELIDQTIAYRKTGQLPACATCEFPTLVVSQTLDEREANKRPNGGDARR